MLFILFSLLTTYVVDVEVHSSKHLSIVFNRGNCSCQKSYYLFLEYIAERTYFDASALPYKTLRLKSNCQIIKEVACLRTISPESNSYYLCPGTSYYKHYGQTARTVQPALRQISQISKRLNLK